MIIREERQDDEERIRTVNLAAFDTSTEADLVDALRRRATPLVSLVAEDDADVIGHILFPDDTFMVLELRDGVLRGLSGTIRYHPVFAEF